MSKLEIIGTNTLVDIDEYRHVPAKVDTGADSSAIWASQIEVNKKGVLRFSLFGPKSPYYTGKVFERKDYKTVKVRSSNGQEQTRYRVCIPVTINGRKIRATFTLADRSRNLFPVLIGRRTLKHKFLVDVSFNVIPEPTKQTRPLKEEVLKAEPDIKPQTKSTQKTKAAPKTKTAPKLTTAKQKAKIRELLHAIMKSDGYIKVAPKRPRRLYFEKYKYSFGLSCVLFRIYTLWQSKDVDLRPEFLKIYPLLRLRRFANRLLTDPKALLHLSSYAVNIICLTELLYPRHQDVVNKLSKIALNIDPDAQPALYVDLCTQIIIADSHYFRRPVSARNKLLLRQLLRRAFVYRMSFDNQLSEQVKQKFLACTKLVGQEAKYRNEMAQAAKNKKVK